jgi:hypothetical protein
MVVAFDEAQNTLHLLKTKLTEFLVRELPH